MRGENQELINCVPLEGPEVFNLQKRSLRCIHLGVSAIFGFIIWIDSEEDFPFMGDLIAEESYIIWIFSIWRKDGSIGGGDRSVVVDQDRSTKPTQNKLSWPRYQSSQRQSDYPLIGIGWLSTSYFRSSKAEVMEIGADVDFWMLEEVGRGRSKIDCPRSKN